MSDWKEALKVGDTVAVKWGYAEYKLVAVTHLTKFRVRIQVNERSECEYNRRTGKAVLSGAWDNDYIREVTPKIQEEIARQNLVRSLEGVKWAEQSDEVLARAWFAVREGAEKKEGAGEMSNDLPTATRALCHQVREFLPAMGLGLVISEEGARRLQACVERVEAALIQPQDGDTEPFDYQQWTHHEDGSITIHLPAPLPQNLALNLLEWHRLEEEQYQFAGTLWKRSAIARERRRECIVYGNCLQTVKAYLGRRELNALMLAAAEAEAEAEEAKK